MKRSLKYFVTAAICTATLITGTIPAFASDKNLSDVIHSIDRCDVILDQNGTVWAYRPAAGGYTEKKVALETDVITIDDFGNYFMVQKKDGTIWEIDFDNGKLSQFYVDADPFNGVRKIKIAQNAKTVSSNPWNIYAVTNNNAYYHIQRTGSASLLPSERYTYQKVQDNVAKAFENILYLTTDGKLYGKNIQVDITGTIPCAQTPRPADWTLIDSNVKDFYTFMNGSTYYYIKNDGSLYGWGNNTFGQLGSRRFERFGTIGVASLTPGEKVSVVMYDFNVEKIMTGVDHLEYKDVVFVYKKDGSIWQMGNTSAATATVNEKGALLAPQLPNDGKPVRVDTATVAQHNSLRDGVTERTYTIGPDGSMIVSGAYGMKEIPDPQKILPYLLDTKTVTNHKINGITVSLH